ETDEGEGVVQLGVLAHRADHTDDDGQTEGEERGHTDQAKGRPQTLGDLRADVVGGPLGGGAELSLKEPDVTVAADPGDPEPVTLRHRSVEVEGFLGLLDGFG